MKFSYKNFSCDVEIYHKDDDFTVRFYDKNKEQDEHQMMNLVIVDPGYGFLCLKHKGKDSALLSGFLDEEVFISEDYVDAALCIIEDLSPTFKEICTPYHIRLFKQTSFAEYNGSTEI
ncbi:hypothetical protein [Paenibacillus sp. DCT19]|uniref:hypothetical protein n=1 Tax=Paenibacillus sp. DCT19 TaxID=2211212 RepID=UPI000FE27B84|nr:hypothetical protein [Paenibacillus sp. DCT19]